MTASGKRLQLLYFVFFKNSAFGTAVLARICDQLNPKLENSKTKVVLRSITAKTFWELSNFFMIWQALQIDNLK